MRQDKRSSYLMNLTYLSLIFYSLSTWRVAATRARAIALCFLTIPEFIQFTSKIELSSISSIRRQCLIFSSHSPSLNVKSSCPRSSPTKRTYAMANCYRQRNQLHISANKLAMQAAETAATPRNMAN